MRRKQINNGNLRKRVMVAIASAALIFTGTAYASENVAYAAGKLTTSEVREFKKYLNDGRGEDTSFMMKKNGCVYGAKFCLYDVNQDGHKDLIVTGYLGMRSMTFTEVYKINTRGKSTQKLAKYRTFSWYDEENDTEYPDGKLLELTYKVNGKKTSKKAYVNAMKKYKFSKVKWHTVNKKNIDKYVK